MFAGGIFHSYLAVRWYDYLYYDIKGGTVIDFDRIASHDGSGMCGNALRLGCVFLILKYAIRTLLKQDNSFSMIKKTERTAVFWRRITALCFWTAKSKKQSMLRLLICVSTVAILTCPVPIIFTISSYFVPAFEGVAMYAIKVGFCLDMMIIFPIGIRTALLHRKKV